MGTQPLNTYTMKMKNKTVYDKVFSGHYGVLYPSRRGEIKIVERDFDIESFKSDFLKILKSEDMDFTDVDVSKIEKTFAEAVDFNELNLFEFFYRWDLIELFKYDLAETPIPFSFLEDLIFKEDCYCEIETELVEINDGYVWFGAQACLEY